MKRRLAQVSRRIRRYGRRGYEIEYVLAYRPQGRRGQPDVRDFAAFARRFVRRFGHRRGLSAIQVTNEVNNFLSPDASDGAYPGARDALVRGLIAASCARMGAGASRGRSTGSASTSTPAPTSRRRAYRGTPPS